MGDKFLNVAGFRQMCGRAGRMGFDTKVLLITWVLLTIFTMQLWVLSILLYIIRGFYCSYCLLYVGFILLG